MITRLEFRRSFREVDVAQWDRLAGEENPFLRHAFFSSLEDSGCLGPQSGWLAFPALLLGESDRLLAAAPCFIKLNSQGEYVFDYEWASAYHTWSEGRAAYYPKIQIAVPFTPVPGPRLLLSPELSPSSHPAVRLALLRGLQQACQELGCSSVHLTFALQHEVETATQEAGYLERLGEQYHWRNPGYASFEEFLAQLSSRKRQAIRRERRIAHSHDLEFVTLLGCQASSDDWNAFTELYRNTAQQKWGRPYLNSQFFQLLGQRMKDRVVLFLAAPRGRPGEWVAGAWNLRGSRALFGRNWGARLTLPMLHFEICYYQAIDYAIAHGLERVEAGAQGLHKLDRGYQPVPIHSAHYLRDPGFYDVVARYLADERREQRERLEALAQRTPFRRSSGN